MLYFSPSTASRPASFLAALGLLATASAAQAQTPASFGPVSTYLIGAGSSPRSVAVGDVNGDGRSDIVTANTDSHTAGVLLGQAGGGFAAISTYSTGAISVPYGVVIADMNGDGKPDIVTANANSSTAGVLLGQAGGGFAAINTYSTGASNDPESVAVADMNGDGQLDIVTANRGTHTVGVLLRQSGGGFAAVTTYPTGANSDPRSVAVADVNGDGRLDIVTANNGTSVVGVLLGQASGGFAAVTTYPTGIYSSPVGVAVADVNGDGRLDIVTANNGTSVAGVLLGQTSGGFAAIRTYSTGIGSGPNGVALADVNGDGQLDIVTANTGGTAGVLLGQAGGSFAAVSTYSTGARTGFPWAVAVADVNGDGRLDIVTANYGTNTAGVLLNTGTFTPLAATPGTAAAEVSLFPNPAHNGFSVKLPAAWGAALVRAELLNPLGQVMATSAVALATSESTFIFATGGLAAGVYVLRVQAGTRTLTKRVVLD